MRYARMAELPKRPKHFPIEIRKAVIHDYKTKMAVADIAKLHDVSPAYVSKVAREEGISRYEARPKTRR
jgi:transposase-like protein